MRVAEHRDFAEITGSPLRASNEIIANQEVNYTWAAILFAEAL